MGFLQIVDGEPDIVLQSVQRLMTQKFFDMVHVGPAPDQLGGAASAEGMGRDAIISHPLGMGMYAFQKCPVFEPCASGGQKKGHSPGDPLTGKDEWP